jgi:hypothetical protein
MSYAEILATGTPTLEDLDPLIQDFVDPASSYEKRSRVLFYLQYFFEKKIFDPTSLMGVIIRVAGSMSYQFLTILLSFCLRNGGDPNSYVMTNTGDPMHVVCYLVSILRKETPSRTEPLDEKAIVFCCMPLIKAGANLNSPAFQTFRRHPSEEETFRRLLDVDPELKSAVTTLLSAGNVREYSVRMWVLSQHTVNLDTPLEDLPLGLQKIIGLSLDIPEIALRGNTIPRFEDIVLTRSIKTLMSIDLSKEESALTMLRGQHVALERVTAAVFVSAWEYLLKIGFVPNYFDMSYLISQILSSNTDRIIRNGLSRLMLLAIQYGANLEDSQATALPMELWNIFEEYYKLPFWKKEALNGGPISKKLLRLALYLCLDINDSKKEIVAALGVIEKIPKDQLLLAAKRRQRLRFGVELGLPEDFLDDKIPTIEIDNKGYVEGDAELYNDYQIALYHSEGKVYAFTSDRFEDILSGKKNPLTGKPLPLAYLHKLTYLASLLEALGIDPRFLMRFDEALEMMNITDYPSRDHSSEAMKELFSTYGLRENLKHYETISASSANAILAEIGMRQNYLDELPGPLRTAVFYHAIEEGLKSLDAYDVKRFFDNRIE